MPPIHAYLLFDGTCASAMRFYEQTLGGTLTLLNEAESPIAAPRPAGSAERILHACLEHDGGFLMASDWMAAEPFEPMQGCSLSISYRSQEQARATFDALAADGEVFMPFEKTFWAEGFGMAKDRFGTRWMVSGPPVRS